MDRPVPSPANNKKGGGIMSAYMVEDSTINNVVNSLANNRNLEYIRRQIKENGYDLETPEGCRLLASEMFSLNIKGVEARYGQGEAKSFRDLNFSYKLTPPVALIQCYKSLSCFLYQCSEGDIYLDNGLFHMLDRVKSDLAEHLVSDLPEYSKANWG